MKQKKKGRGNRQPRSLIINIIIIATATDGNDRHGGGGPGGV
jgi:hypothetical protein